MPFDNKRAGWATPMPPLRHNAPGSTDWETTTRPCDVPLDDPWEERPADIEDGEVPYRRPLHPVFGEWDDGEHVDVPDEWRPALYEGAEQWKVYFDNGEPVVTSARRRRRRVRVDIVGEVVTADASLGFDVADVLRFDRDVALAGDEECWAWTGTHSLAGYGVYKGQQAHRVAYRRWCGPIPHGLQIDHLCCNTGCVNPRHLEAVTRAENDRRKVAHRRSKRESA